MGIPSAIAKITAKFIAPRIYREQQNAIEIQQSLLHRFIAAAHSTAFGKEHSYHVIKKYSDYQSAVPIREYEGIKTYIEQIANGEENILWPGKPLYFCKSSGTTSGTKYIPVTKLQIDEMIRAARNSLLMYVAETGKAGFFDHQMMFLQGSPELENYGTIPSGRLSGIVYHHVPSFANRSRMPSYTVNCIPDWEEKVEAIARETLKKRMGLISGIPPWCVMYFEQLREQSGKEFIKDIFPDFSVFAYGGVSYEPYRNKIEKLIGFPIDTIETYPASEGFIAFQDLQREDGLLLNVNGGIFYEFVRAEDAYRENPERISLQEVEIGVPYALILTTNAGLWAYQLGDTIKFISKHPYRILMTGRIKHFISAFGEHVIGEEVEFSLRHAMLDCQAGVSEFTVAPQVNPPEGLPYHEWLIEFSHAPHSMESFAAAIDHWLQQRNPYYRDLRTGHVLQQLKITALKPNTFVNYMKKQGKLGGQNKVPRLTNDRHLADELAREAI